MSTVSIARAQVRHQYQTWTAVTLTKDLAPRWRAQFETNPRFYDFDDDFHPFQLRLRAGLGYELAPGMFLYAGYTWAPAWNQQHAFVDEHRVWQQWSYDIPGLPGAVRLELRTRIEERFRTDTPDPFAVRIRQRVRAAIPFAENFPLYFAVWDELFVAFHDAHVSDAVRWQGAGLDANRIFVGLGYEVDPDLRFELGYLNQWRRQDPIHDMHHALSLDVQIRWR